MTITPELLATHKLNTAEYEKIVALLGRTPSITELGIFSVMSMKPWLLLDWPPRRDMTWAMLGSAAAIRATSA